MVHQRPIVEVGAQGCDNDDRAVCRVDGIQNQIEKLLAIALLLHLCEQLFELVNHQQQLAVSGRQSLVDAARQAIDMLAQGLDNARQRRSRDAQEGGRQLLQRHLARYHFGIEPILRARYAARSQGGQDPRFHQAGFAAAARADDGEEIALNNGFLQAVQHALDHRGAAEEIGGVRLLEGAQTFVRILGLDQFKFGEVKLF